METVLSFWKVRSSETNKAELFRIVIPVEEFVDHSFLYWNGFESPALKFEVVAQELEVVVYAALS